MKASEAKQLKGGTIIRDTLNNVLGVIVNPWLLGDAADERAAYIQWLPKGASIWSNEDDVMWKHIEVYDKKIEPILTIEQWEQRLREIAERRYGLKPDEVMTGPTWHKAWFKEGRSPDDYIRWFAAGRGIKELNVA